MTSSPFSDSISLRLHSFLEFNLATYNNSLDRSTKSTISRLKSLYLLVNIGFQVLFHSPPGVLFTFPSRYSFTIGYQVVFSLTGWSPLFHTRFPDMVIRTPYVFLLMVWALSVSLATTPEIIIYFLFLWVLRCFSSPRSPLMCYFTHT